MLSKGLQQVWQRALTSLDFAVQSMWSARRRMWLVVLGAAIGFGAIDSMLIIGSSVQARIQASLDSLGGDVLTLSLTKQSQESDRLGLPGGRAAPKPRTLPANPHAAALDAATIAHLIQAMPQVESVGWARRVVSCNTPKADDAQQLEPILVDIGLQNLLSLKLSAGRQLLPADQDQPNLLLGAEALTALKTQMPWLTVGSSVQYCGRKYRIVGVLQPHPGSDFVQAMRINSSALIASSQAAAEEANSPSTLLVRLRSGTPAQSFAAQLTARVQPLLPGYDVQASGAWEFIKLRQEQASLYARFLAVLGSVSLLVGALGIANMMLVTVSERRAEIGLRMALGAKRMDILAQFVFEAVLICLVGSAVGLLLGWGVAKLALNLGGFDTVLSLSVVIYASLLAVVCGIVSGAYPAHRAASIDPVVSLQG